MSGAIVRTVRDGARAYAADLDVSQQMMAVRERIDAHPQVLGWNCIEYALPVTFPRAPDATVARLLVHAGLVAALQQKGFVVRIAGTEARPTMLVGWRSSVGHGDLRRLQERLDRLRLGDEQSAEAFRATGHARPRAAAGLSHGGPPHNASVPLRGGPPAAGLPRRFSSTAGPR